MGHMDDRSGAPQRGDLPVACTLGASDGPSRLQRWQYLHQVTVPVAQLADGELEVGQVGLVGQPAAVCRCAAVGQVRGMSRLRNPTKLAARPAAASTSRTTPPMRSIPSSITLDPTLWKGEPLTSHCGRSKPGPR